MQKHILKIVASVLCLAVMNGAIWVADAWSAGSDNLTLQNQTIASGQQIDLSARQTISAGPAYVISSGATVTLRAGNKISLLPGFQAASGSNVSMNIGWGDITPPRIISSWPGSGTMGTNGGPLTISYVFDDNGGTGIYAVKFFEFVDPGSNIATDITALATHSDSTLSYVIAEPVDGQTYRFRISLEDVAGNVNEQDLSITIDNSVLSTTANPLGGDYTAQAPIQVTISSTKVATIYYSTDGYPPFEGAANTLSGTAPVTVQISKTTLLMFFAVDQTGKREDTNRQVYFVSPGNKLDQVGGLNANYQTEQKSVAIAWNGVAGAAGYHVYRCGNAIECAVLADSGKGGYQPSAVFLLTSATVSSHSDGSVAVGGAYSYAVAAYSSAGVEGTLSSLVPVSITAATPAVDQEEAKLRATAWLESQQNLNGYWSDKDGRRILATSQALNALRLNNTDSAALRQGVFYLRGHQADNNDYLARQIATLRDYGQDTGELTTVLLSEGYFVDKLYGWGVESRYYLDALSTALAVKSLEGSEAGGLLDDDRGYRQALTGQAPLLTYPVKSTTIGRFSWAAGNPASVYDSALVYHILDTHYPNEPHAFDQSWIVSAQNATNGSFGTGLVDTAAVLLWLPLGEPARLAAGSYLVGQQNINGSWNNDPYLTGLCLEALLSN